jgi:hypothetical protein
MAKKDEKTYQQDGKTITIIPAKRAKKAVSETEAGDEKKEKPVREKKPSKKELERGIAKFAVDDKVSLKNIPPQYSGAGFTEAVIVKVFKSSYDQTFRYSIRSLSGHELAMVKEDQLKPRKTNFKK